MNRSKTNRQIKILSVAAVIVGLLLSATTSRTHDYINSQFALVRYNINGGLDTTFADDGGLATDFPSSLGEEANALALDAGGKIVAAGFVGDDPIFY